MVKLENISNYWDTESVATWFYHNREDDYKHLYQEDFLSKYLAITNRYEVAVPAVTVFLNQTDPIGSILELRETQPNVCPLLYFYYHPLLEEQFGKNALVCPSWMYVNTHGQFRKVLVTDLNDLSNEIGSENGDVPLAVSALKNCVTLQINTDGLFPLIPFSDKAYRQAGLDFSKNLDNSDLATLNTPRFNGFIHDFSVLMAEYGFTRSFEAQLDNADHLINESGIVL